MEYCSFIISRVLSNKTNLIFTSYTLKILIKVLTTATALDSSTSSLLSTVKYEIFVNK